jgi:heme exporter protein A
MLTVENLSCLYAGRGVFAPVSFTVAPQEIVVLRGRNGIGKTTLLRTLAGLPVEYTGNYTVENEAHRKSLQRKGRITSESWYPDFYSPLYIPYSPPLNPHLTVSEQLTYWEHLYKNTYQRNTVDDFFLLQHQRNTLCVKLSAGQRQILSLSRLLFFASNPCKLWLLDEPTTALDSVAEKKFYALLAENKEKGGSCVIATHQNLGVKTDKIIELQQFTENSSQDIFAAWQS